MAVCPAELQRHAKGAKKGRENMARARIIPGRRVLRADLRRSAPHERADCKLQRMLGVFGSSGLTS